MGAISIGGLGSGLDVSSIIDALVAAERAPQQNSLDRLETDVSVTLTGLSGLSGALDELRSAAFDLSISSNFSQRSVSISDSTFFEATATTDASPGEYDIEVTAIAQGSRHETSIFTGGSTSTFGDGTLTFSAGIESFNITISATDTLETIRDNINAATGNDFVSVNLLNNVSNGVDTGSVLSFNSSTTGVGNDLEISFTGDASLSDLAPAVAIENATDASIEIDGFTATSSSNTFTDIIQGTTIDVLQTNNPGETENLNISLDKAGTTALISTFVETYNAYVTAAGELGSAEEDSPGLLLGDSTLRQVSSQIRNLLSSSISAVTGNSNSLTAIGITTTQEGFLEIDQDLLDRAVEEDFEDFDELFAGEAGFAAQLRDLINNYTGVGGIIKSRQDTLNEQLSDISDSRISLELRIDQLQLRLTNQFASVDAIVAQLNSTQSFVQQQFENLSNNNN